MLCLALALVAVTTSTHTLQLLRQARGNLEKAQNEAILDGAHLEAAASVIRSGQPGPFEWTTSSGLGWLRIRAESEADKVGPDAVSELDDTVLTALGVAAPDILRARAGVLEADASAGDVAALDIAPLWRACGPNLLSARGTAEQIDFRPALAPARGTAPPAWHIGETWRIRIATAAGWRDDRIVRFTGSARHPVAVVKRDLSRGTDRWGECEELLTGLFGA